MCLFVPVFTLAADTSSWSEIISWTTSITENLSIDYCPNGDFSPSYYDHTCGEPQSSFTTSQNILDFWKAISLLSLSTDSARQNIKWKLLTREQAPQIFINFLSYIQKTLPTSSKTCNFSDITNLNQEFQSLIRQSCHLWIFQWTSQNRFYPNAYLTNAEAITAIIRIIHWQQNEFSSLHWSEPYYSLAKKDWIIQSSTLYSKFAPITQTNLLSLLFYASQISAKSTRDTSNYNYSNSTSSNTSSASTCDTLKSLARQVYTGSALTDALAKIDKKC